MSWVATGCNVCFPRTAYNLCLQAVCGRRKHLSRVSSNFSSQCRVMRAAAQVRPSHGAGCHTHHTAAETGIATITASHCCCVAEALQLEPIFCEPNPNGKPYRGDVGMPNNTPPRWKVSHAASVGLVFKLRSTNAYWIGSTVKEHE